MRTGDGEAGRQDAKSGPQSHSDPEPAAGPGPVSAPAVHRVSRGPIDPRLLRHARTSRTGIALLAVIGTGQAAATIAIAVALCGIVTGLADRSVPAFPGALTGTAAILLLAAAFTARAGLAWAEQVVAQRTAAKVTDELRRSLLDRVIGRGPAWVAAYGSGRLTTVLGAGLDALRPWFSGYLPALVLGVVLPPLVVVIMVAVDPTSAVIALLTLPLLPILGALIGWATKTRAERRWAADARLAGHFLDVVRGLTTLKMYGRAERQIDVIADLTDRHRAATMRVLRVAFLSSTALDLVGTLAVGLIAVQAGLRVAGGGMDLGPALLVILLAPEAYRPLREVAARYHASTDAGAVIADVDEILSSPTGQVRTSPPAAPGPPLTGDPSRAGTPDRHPHPAAHIETPADTPSKTSGPAVGTHIGTRANAPAMTPGPVGAHIGTHSDAPVITHGPAVGTNIGAHAGTRANTPGPATGTRIGAHSSALDRPGPVPGTAAGARVSAAESDQIEESLSPPRGFGLKDAGRWGVRAAGVRARYPGSFLDALRLPELVVHAGELVALRGPSGAGKTTALRVLAGLHPAESGALAVGSTFYLPQRSTLPHARTVAEAFPVDTTPADIRAALDAVGLIGEITPDTPLGEQVSGVSAGQRQRLAFAVLRHRAVRALSDGRPSRCRAGSSDGRPAPRFPRPVVTLLLDEPTAHLDVTAERLVIARLRDLAVRGCAVLVVAHRPALLAAADRIVDVATPAGPASLTSTVTARTPNEAVQPPWSADPSTNTLGLMETVSSSPTSIGSDPDGTQTAITAVGSTAIRACRTARTGRATEGPENGAADTGDDRCGSPPQPETPTGRTDHNQPSPPLRLETPFGRIGQAGVGRWDRLRRPWIAAALGAGSSLAGILLTGAAAWLLVRASSLPPVLSLSTAVVLVRGSAVARPLLRYLERLLAHDVAFARLGARRARVYADLIPHVPGPRLHRRGDLLTRLVDDVDTRVDGLLRGRLPMLAAAATAVAGVLAVAWTAPALAVPVAAGLLVAGVLAPAIAAHQVDRREAATGAARSALRDALVETVDGVEELSAGSGRQGVPWQRSRVLAELEARAAREAGLAAATAHLGWGAAAAGVAVLLARTGLSAEWSAVVLLGVIVLGESVIGLPEAAIARRRAAGAEHRVATLTATDAHSPIPVDVDMDERIKPDQRPHGARHRLARNAPHQPPTDTNAQDAINTTTPQQDRPNDTSAGKQTGTAEHPHDAGQRLTVGRNAAEPIGMAETVPTLAGLVRLAVSTVTAPLKQHPAPAEPARRTVSTVTPPLKQHPASAEPARRTVSADSSAARGRPRPAEQIDYSASPPENRHTRVARTGGPRPAAGQQTGGADDRPGPGGSPSGHEEIAGVTAAAGRGGVRVSGLVAGWDPRREPVLDGLDLWLPAGSKTVVTGRSGSGKSTLAAVLAGLLEPRAGSVSADHGPTVLVGEETGHVFASSLRENLRLGAPGAGDERLVAALERVGLGAWSAGLPEGLDTWLGTGGSTVSGGQRRRLATARALLADPALLILDEPTEGIDEDGANRLMADLLGAADGRTVLVFAHRFEGFRLADRVLSLSRGKMTDITL
ncbi:ATP-binding cassette domain-containing protein [Actinoplanes sp. NPDC049802]|uniref:ATP-binding cassette domain-containing protein n=1 Tax=Actinoplanes sp. NPDC049802 TaxID=3154742 RepID=UPI0033D43A77